MLTTRRGFLAALAASFVADPERLLWVPGAKMISIPKPYQAIPPFNMQAFMALAMKAIADSIEQQIRSHWDGNNYRRETLTRSIPIPHSVGRKSLRSVGTQNSIALTMLPNTLIL